MSVNPASFTPEKLAAITGKITPAMIPVLTGLSSPIGVYNDATAVATKFNGILQLLNQMVGSTANIAEANRLAFPDVVKTHLEQLRSVPSRDHPRSVGADLIVLGLCLLPSGILCRAPGPHCKDWWDDSTMPRFLSSSSFSSGLLHRFNGSNSCKGVGVPMFSCMRAGYL